MARKSPAAAFVPVLVLALACACGVPYDRYIQEGNKYRSQNDSARAKESFQKAALSVRSDEKQKEKLINALLLEKDCACDLHQNDEAVRLLAEITRILEKAGNYKRAAGCKKQMGDLTSVEDASTALAYYQAALADLKTAGFEVSPEAAAVLAAVGHLKSGVKDYQAAAPYLEKACAILDKIKYNENDHDHAVYLNELAYVYQQLNRDDEAVVISEQARKLEMSGINYRVDKRPRL
jgi:tetratricopeptide (TPR) repeat protein